VESAATKIGGVAGLAAALAALPAYLVGTPDAPRTAGEASSYYEQGSTFVDLNGALPLLHILFGLVFLGVLVRVLRAASGPTGAVYTALAGGVVYLCLGAAGFAAEVAYPAALLRFGDIAVTAFTQPLLTLAVWFYHYSQIGAAAMILASSVVLWTTAVLPKWTAFGAVLGVLPLLHLWLPLPAAFSSLIWIAFIGLVLLVVTPRTSVEGAAPVR
jgi:hypothetical protein